MSLARDIADLASVTARLDTVGASSGALSNRNILMNGAMQVFQRGTSFSGNSAYNADRWKVDNNSGGGGQSTDAPDGFTYSLKIDPSSGNAALRQAIELPAAGEGGVFRSGQKFTLSFYLKSDNAGEAINIFAASSTTVDGATTAQVNDTSTGLTTATSWTRYTYTFTSNNVGGSDTCYNIVPYVSSPSGATYWTGFQLEVGPQSTSFEHEPTSVVLNKCHRYYNQIQKGAYGCASASGNPVFHYFPPVEMRVAPSYSLSVNKVTMGDMIAQGFNLTGATISANTHNSSSGCVWVFAASSFSATMTNYRPLLLESSASFNGEVQMSAEF